MQRDRKRKNDRKRERGKETERDKGREHTLSSSSTTDMYAPGAGRYVFISEDSLLRL